MRPEGHSSGEAPEEKIWWLGAEAPFALMDANARRGGSLKHLVSPFKDRGTYWGGLPFAKFVQDPTADF